MISCIPIDSEIFNPPELGYWFSRRGKRVCRAQLGMAVAKMADALEAACTWQNPGYVSVADFLVQQTLIIPVPGTHHHSSFLLIDEQDVRRAMAVEGLNLERFDILIQRRDHWWGLRREYVITFSELPSEELQQLSRQWDEAVECALRSNQD